LAAATYGTALAAATLWGFLHWTVNVPQQLRAVAAAPAAAPLVLGLHQSTIYAGITLGTIIGFAGNDLAGRAGIAGCALVVGALAVTVIRLSIRPSAEPPPADESPDPEPSLARP
jgi:predicted MFS family arabinose efflux permease